MISKDEYMSLVDHSDWNDEGTLPPEEPPTILLDDGTIIAQGAPLVVILGPCVIESEEHSLRMADNIQTICMELGANFVFKSSFDKANRSSVNSYRGPGLIGGLNILQKVKDKIGCPVLTDVHECFQVDQVAQVADIIQIPAFLCRQTDLLLAASKMKRPVNIKKGQFVSAEDMEHAIKKIEHYGNNQILLTERGSMFGYGNLIVDYRNLAIMRQFGYPVCFDATHSTQKPGGGPQSGGNSEFAPMLAKAAVAVGVDAIFAEVHDDPKNALSDSSCQISLYTLENMLRDILKIREALEYGD
jgi:2-dehydro-3-deoxyphosphooctonate aldolase (KDO 8-P synthase)